MKACTVYYTRNKKSIGFVSRLRGIYTLVVGSHDLEDLDVMVECEEKWVLKSAGYKRKLR
jgi:hypothetical protein